jgi:hypothetical protein
MHILSDAFQQHTFFTFYFTPLPDVEWDAKMRPGALFLRNYAYSQKPKWPFLVNQETHTFFENESGKTGFDDCRADLKYVTVSTLNNTTL